MENRSSSIPTQRVFRFGNGAPLSDLHILTHDEEVDSVDSYPGINISHKSSEADDSSDNGIQKGLLPSRVPSHLLMISILEQLCLMYAQDNSKGAQLFKIICEQLVMHQYVSPFTILDEMKSIRSQYRFFMHHILKAAMLKVSQGPPALPSHIDVPIAVASLPGLRHQMSFVSTEEMVQMQTPRYKTEFTEVQKIGKGGFGSVYKARHNLDGRMYAIKKIKFKHSKPEVWMRVLREVKALANLQHPNIVGYNAAWLESTTTFDAGNCSVSPNSGVSSPADVSFQPPPGETDDSVVFAASGQDVQGLLTHSGASETSNFPVGVVRVQELDISESDGLCKACMMNEVEEKADGNHSGFIKNKPKHSCAMKFFASEFTDPFSSVQKDNDRGKAWDLVETNGTFWNKQLRVKRSISYDHMPTYNSQEEKSQVLQMRVSLFIQMELCSLTLKDWLQKRNTQCLCIKDLQEYAVHNMRIFKQILKGVEFIHNNGIIHRDLKPRNIFLHEPELHVKIGDFGLAKDELVKDSEDVLLTPSPVDMYDEFTWEKHTSGVGTSTYAAPEQLDGSAYSNKSDVYSLGIILFEMFHSFQTEMEKFHCLDQLRKYGKLDQEFSQAWPTHASYVKLMTSSYPHERPKMRELLNSELFKTKDQVLLELRKELKDKDKEIERLREKIREKDNLLLKIQRDLNKVPNIQRDMLEKL